MQTAPAFTHAQLQELRRLGRLAYERELSSALQELEAEFARWHAGQIVATELAEAIQGFQEGIARELGQRQAQVPPPQLVARALASGMVQESELDPAVLALLRPSIELYRWQGSVADEDEADHEEG